MAVFVVFITTYMLILPAITLSVNDLSPTLSIDTITYQNATYDGSDYTAYFSTTLEDITDTQIQEIINNGGVCYLYFPEGISVSNYDSTVASTGTDSNGNVIFTYYYKYTDEGILYAEITFTDGYLKSLSGGQLTDVYFNFNATIDSSYTDDSTGNVVLNSDEYTLTIDVSDITSTDNSSTPTADISVNKEASSYSMSDGTITYTVYVSSVNGTDGSISLDDLLTVASGLNIDSIEVNSVILQTQATQYYNYTTTSSSVEYTSSADVSTSSLSMTLPALTGSDDYYSSRYVITYTVKLADITDYTITSSVGNSITASAKTDWNNTTITTSDSTSTTVRFNLISKTGSLSGTTATWTITLNSDNQNLAGMTLTDTMFSELTETQLIKTLTAAGLSSSDYTIQYASDGKTITGIKFSDNENTKTYVITYTTSTEDVTLADDSTLSNTATLTGGILGDDGLSGTGTVYPSTGSVDKSDATVTAYDDDNAEVLLNWTNTVNIPVGGIASGTVIGDYLNGTGGYMSTSSQWFTWDQIESLYNVISELTVSYSGGSVELDLGTQYTVEVYDITQSAWIDITTVTGDSTTYGSDKFTAFEITFTTDVSVGKEATISISYGTTASRKDISSVYYYSNELTAVNEKTLTDWGYHTEYTNVQKTDAKGTSGDTAITIDSDDGTIGWYAKVYIRSGSNGTYIVTDTLPSVVTLSGVYVSTSQQGTSGTQIISSDGIVYSINTVSGVTAEISTDGQTITLTITSDAYGSLATDGGYYWIYYECKLTDDTLTTLKTEGSSYHIDATNNVSVKYNDDDYGSSSQKQAVTYDADGSRDALSKSYEWNGNTSIITYTVLINPDAASLAEGNDLTLEDTLTANYSTAQGWGVYAALVSGSVHFYAANADGTADTDQELDVSWNYSESETDWGNYISKLYTISSTSIPDATAIVLTYQYEIWSDAGNIDGLSNKVTLNGSTNYSDSTKSSDSYSGSHLSAGVGGSVSQYTIVKVDADNNSKTLSGAVYTLYAWDNTAGDNQSGDWVVVTTYTTGDSGTVVVYDNDCTPNTAYKLVETSAPDGYELDAAPYYFYKSSTNTTKYPENYPSTDFTTSSTYDATDLASRSRTVYADNSAVETTSISVKKVWQDENGDEITDTSGLSDVKLSLYRYTKTSGSSEKVAVTLKDGGLYNEADLVNVTRNVAKDGDVTIVFNGTTDGNWVSFYAYYYTDSKANSTEITPTSVVNGSDYTYTVTINSSALTADMVVAFSYSGLTIGTITINDILVYSTTSTTSDASDAVNSSSTFTNTDATIVKNVTLSESNNWSVELTDLPLSDSDGNTYYYYFLESSVDGYTTTYSNSSGITSGDVTVVNKKNPEDKTTSITAVKSWVASDGTTAITSLDDQTDITLDVYQYETTSAAGTGTSSGNTVKLYVYDDTPSSIQSWKSGNCVKEIQVSKDQDLTINISNCTYCWYFIGTSGSQQGGAYGVVTISLSSEDITDDIYLCITEITTDNVDSIVSVVSTGTGTAGGTGTTVTKPDDNNATKCGSVTVKKSGSGELSATVSGFDEDSSVTATVINNEDGTWSIVLNNLDYISYDSKGTHYYYYYFIESSVDGYTTTYSTASGVTDNGEITITNKAVSGTYTYANISVSKEWKYSGNNSNETVTDTDKSPIILTLYRVSSSGDVKEIGTATLDGTADSVAAGDSTDGVETAAWTTQWMNLIQSFTDGDNNTTTYTYYLVETPSGSTGPTVTVTVASVQGGEGTSVSESTITLGSATGGYNITTSADGTAYVTVTNTIDKPSVPTTSLTVTKVWQYYDGTYYTTLDAPDNASVTLVLYQKASNASTGTEYSINGTKAEATISSSNSWTYTWEDLPTCSSADSSITYQYYVVEESATNAGNYTTIYYTTSDVNTANTQYAAADVSYSTTASDYEGSSEITIANVWEKKDTSFYISKKWENGSGTEIDNPVDASATFEVIRVLTYNGTVVSGRTVSLGKKTVATNGWTASWPDLPTTMIAEVNGEYVVCTCTYYITETGASYGTSTADFTVNYSNGTAATIDYTGTDDVTRTYYLVDTQTAAATITVTNATQDSFVLPVTGGTGIRNLIIVFGTGLMMFAIAVILARQREKRRWSSA